MEGNKTTRRSAVPRTIQLGAAALGVFLLINLSYRNFERAIQGAIAWTIFGVIAVLVVWISERLGWRVTGAIPITRRKLLQLLVVFAAWAGCMVGYYFYCH